MPLCYSSPSKLIQPSLWRTVKKQATSKQSHSHRRASGSDNRDKASETRVSIYTTPVTCDSQPHTPQSPTEVHHSHPTLPRTVRPCDHLGCLPELTSHLSPAPLPPGHRHYEPPWGPQQHCLAGSPTSTLTTPPCTPPAG